MGGFLFVPGTFRVPGTKKLPVWKPDRNWLPLCGAITFLLPLPNRSHVLGMKKHSSNVSVTHRYVSTMEGSLHLLEMLGRLKMLGGSK